MGDKTFKRWVLYIGEDANDPNVFCPGSRKAMSLIEPIKEDVLVQKVETLLEKDIELPTWLTGTPTCVDTQTKLCYTGTEAISQLQEITQPARDKRSIGFDDMQGVSADGQILEFEQDSAFAAPLQARDDVVQSGKVTEEEVQKYIAARNASIPPPPQV